MSYHRPPKKKDPPSDKYFIMTIVVLGSAGTWLLQSWWPTLIVSIIGAGVWHVYDKKHKQNGL